MKWSLIRCSRAQRKKTTRTTFHHMWSAINQSRCPSSRCSINGRNHFDQQKIFVLIVDDEVFKRCPSKRDFQTDPTKFWLIFAIDVALRSNPTDPYHRMHLKRRVRNDERHRLLTVVKLTIGKTRSSTTPIYRWWTGWRLEWMVHRGNVKVKEFTGCRVLFKWSMSIVDSWQIFSAYFSSRSFSRV